jgi:hypothetical protein
MACPKSTFLRQRNLNLIIWLKFDLKINRSLKKYLNKIILIDYKISAKIDINNKIFIKSIHRAEQMIKKYLIINVIKYCHLAMTFILTFRITIICYLTINLKYLIDLSRHGLHLTFLIK